MDWSEINELQKEIKKEENRQMIEGCMITSPDSIVSISELGKYIEGYDLRKNLKFGWKDIRTIAGYAIPTLFFLSPLLWVLIYPCFSEVSVSEFFAEYLLEKKNYFILVGCTVMGAFLVWGTWERITNWRSFPKGVLIYEGGLVWLTSDKYTKELKEHVRINFNDVNKIHCERHVHYKNESSKRYYDETSYELSIEGQKTIIEN